MAKYITMIYCRRINWSYFFNPQVKWTNRQRQDSTNHKNHLFYAHVYFNKHNLKGFRFEMLIKIQNISISNILHS